MKYRGIALAIVVCFLAMLTACQSEESIYISGVIHNPGNVKVVSFYEGERKLDSVYLGDGNKFRFDRPSTQARLLNIEAGKNRYPVIVEPGEELKFSADLQDPTSYEVSGSALSLALQEFAPAQRRLDVFEDSLHAAFTRQTVNRTAEEVQNLRSQMLEEFEPEMSRYVHEAVVFAQQQPNLAGFYAMSTLDPEFAEAELIAYGDRIKDEFPDNRYVTEFKAEIDKLRALAVGQPAPEFEAYTPNNKLVKLSDFKGQYTLIDFWASWCVPCREENPNIVAQYERFKDKGFTVLGVSLDNNPGSWMRAIEDDNLKWTNISDLQAWSSDLIIKYRIKAIPTSYIVDPEGRIVAKNLRGKELENFLVRTLN